MHYELDPIAKAAADFIRQFDWNWWCTLSFEHPPTFTKAAARFNHWVNWLNRKTFGHFYYKRPGQGLRWVRGVELQQREAIHFHALVAGNPRPSIPEASERWHDNNKIEPYDSSRKAAEYMVKEYAAEGNLDFGGVWHSSSQLSGLIESCARFTG